MLKNIILVGLGGGIGSIGRFLFGYYFKSIQIGFLTPTLIINIIGSILIGILMGVFEKNYSDPSLRLFFVLGICGGFTTFSTFSYENLQFLFKNQINYFFYYTISSVFISIVGTYLGYKIIEKII